MENTEQNSAFDPNGVGVKNNHFIGLPFDENSAQIILLPVPWDVTVSYGAGTASGPSNILNASTQLDLFDPHVSDAWKMGLFMKQPDERWEEISTKLREISASYIEFLENGGNIEESSQMKENLDFLNQISGEIHEWVYEESKVLLEKNKKVGIVGGEHSVPYGYLRALSEKYSSFGVLHIDAHMDLRKAYEGFTYSHASIFYNASKLPSIQKIVQVGIRDYCDEEIEFAQHSNEQIQCFFDHQLKASAFEGKSWKEQCQEIIEQLPDQVYISFDIDGLKPELCPNTGTPVPGGLEYDEAIYLLNMLVESGRSIIGFDLSEVAGGNKEWDGNVGARILYKLSNLMGKSQQLKAII